MCCSLISIRSAGLSCLLLATAASVGCNMGSSHPLIQLQQDQIDEIRILITAIDQVQDDESAMAQMEAIGNSFDELTRIKQELPILLRKHAKDNLLKSTVERVQKDQAQADREFEIATERIANMKDLPVPFCSMLRHKVTVFMAATIDAMKQISTIPGAPPMGDLNSIPDLQGTIDLYERHGPENVVELSVFGHDPNLAQTLKEAGDAETCLIMDVDETIAIVAPVKDFDAFCKRLAETGDVSERVDSRRELDYTVRKEPPAVAAADSPPRGGVGTFHEAGDGSVEPSGQSAAERHAENALRMARRAEREMLNDEGPVDPKDYPTLARQLASGNSIDQARAARRLVEVDPSDVSDSELRKQIARGFRTMALESKFDQDLAVQGLVRWSGKYSVPILVQLMDREKMSVDDPIFDALGNLKDPRGAEAVARRLGNFFNHENAVTSLRQMGPAAEDALIDVAPSNDAKTSLAAIELLGEVGTPKSYDMLRQAMKSTNRQVRDVAKRSLKAIRERESQREG